MQPPSNSNDVGWFKFGTRPGELGSTVIAGHFNGKNGEKGVFSDLSKLATGDKFYIKDVKDNKTSFTVRENRTYDSGYADEVFGLSDKAYLNLITCDGVWDTVKKSYSKRLVVFAEIDK